MTNTPEKKNITPQCPECLFIGLTCPLSRFGHNLTILKSLDEVNLGLSGKDKVSFEALGGWRWLCYRSTSYDEETLYQTVSDAQEGNILPLFIKIQDILHHLNLWKIHPSWEYLLCYNE